MVSLKTLICLIAVLGLFVATFAQTPDTPSADSSPDVPSGASSPSGSDSPSGNDAPSGSDSPSGSDGPSGSEGPSGEDGPSSNDEVEREFKFEFEDDRVFAEVRLRDGESESRLKHEVDATSNGVEFRVRFEQEIDNADSELRMRLRLFDLIEYVPTGDAGYQSEAIVNTYSNWQWAKFVDATPAGSTGRVFTLATTDGIFAISIRVNIPAQGTLVFKPEDIKFDVELNTDLMSAAGWLNGTEVALRAALSTSLETEREHDDDTNTTQNAINANSADMAGLFLSWVNYIECDGTGKVSIVSSPLRQDDSQRDSDDDADSTAHVVAFAFINLKDAPKGNCVWDPVVGINSVNTSAGSALMMSWAVVLAVIYALF